jgi:hypothetical protein
MGDFQKYWSQNVGQDFLFIVLDIFVGGISCGRKRCMREINASRAWDPVHAGVRLLRGRLQRKGGGSTGMIYPSDKIMNQSWANEWIYVGSIWLFHGCQNTGMFASVNWLMGSRKLKGREHNDKKKHNKKWSAKKGMKWKTTNTTL